MIWEYLILGLIVGWAVFYLWRTFFRKGGCACGSCPSAKSADCPTRGTPDLCTLTDVAEPMTDHPSTATSAPRSNDSDEIPRRNDP